MTTTTVIDQWRLQELLANARPRLQGLCAYLTSDPDSAEDLVQEVLLEAWRSFANLRNPEAVDAWLNGIVRNVCARWQRTRRRDALLHDEQDRQGKTGSTALLDSVAEPFDLELMLNRQELALLLDRAMALLPPETRGLLVQHYLEELPQAELAAKVGMSTGTLAVRLHRGKLALRHLLTTDFSDDAIALGLITPAATGWRPTRIWCFYCGQHYLEAQFNRAEDQLRLRCLGCCNPHDENDFLSNSRTPILRAFKTYKPALNCVANMIYTNYIKNAQSGIAHCFECGQETPIRSGSPPGYPVGSSDLYLWCERCQGFSNESWGSLALSLPEVRQFWQENPRMHLIPARRMVIANTPAVLVSFASITSGAQIEAAFATKTFDLIYVE
ncbi:MAG: RNA polymerase sigma factor [Caldilineaceae bacterium]